MNKIRVIKQSVVCQWLGLCSLVPVIGVGFAMVAFRRYRKVRPGVGDEWNPARPELIRGVVFARAGIYITLAVIVAIALRLRFEIIAAGGS